VVKQVLINLICANWAHLKEQKHRKLATEKWYKLVVYFNRKDISAALIYTTEGARTRHGLFLQHSTICGTWTFKAHNFIEHATVCIAEHIHKLQLHINY